MPKILFLDSYYPAVLRDLPLTYSYEDRVKQLSRLMFGTSDFYSHAFKKMGWEAADIVVNDQMGLNLWAKENNDSANALRFIERYKPDVLYCQDLSVIHPSIFKTMKADGTIKLLAAQHSCPWAGDGNVGSFDIVFSSFPHYLPRINALGVKSEFLQIGFGGQRVLDAVYRNTPPKPPSIRPYKISFAGGIGGGRTAGHWNAGTDLLRKVAEAFPDDFHWWGYGSEMLSQDDPLYQPHHGPAWGQIMYNVYSNSRIIINRHGEVAEGYSNNMRLFEATGMGAVLMTEKSKNLDQYFDDGLECIAYDTNTIVDQIKGLLADPDSMDFIAFRGQEKTLSNHTYDKILEPVSSKLTEMLKNA